MATDDPVSALLHTLTAIGKVAVAADCVRTWQINSVSMEIARPRPVDHLHTLLRTLQLTARACDRRAPSRM